METHQVGFESTFLQGAKKKILIGREIAKCDFSATIGPSVSVYQ